MSLRIRLAFATALLTLPLAPAAFAQTPPQAEGTPAQREAMAALDFMNGEWRGEAVTYGPSGRHVLTQTERVGPMLGGSIKVIEGRGYSAEGVTEFNAMAILSWDARGNRYVFRSWANGYSGEYPFERTEDGFRWETPAGPNAKIQYVATVRDGTWHEVGTYVAEGQPPRPYVELTLTRISDTTWPAAGAVDPAQ